MSTAGAVLSNSHFVPFGFAWIGMMLVLLSPSIAPVPGHAQPRHEEADVFEPGFDRLDWLGGVTARLVNSAGRPRCIGPLGCKMNIPEGSPCRRPPERRPKIIVDGVVPGGAPDTWVLAYRLLCSACYEGGTSHLVMLTVDSEGQVQIIHKFHLKGNRSNRVPGPLEMTSYDFDDDGRLEISCRYRYLAERKTKCTGFRDAAEYLLLARPEDNSLRVLYHEQTVDIPEEDRESYRVVNHFEDVNDDGYSDLVLTFAVQGKDGCKSGRKKCASKGLGDVAITRRIHLFDESGGGWKPQGLIGRAIGPPMTVDCDIPMPEKPFAVITRMYSDKKLDRTVEQEAAALRNAGFLGACTYSTEDLAVFRPPTRFVTIAGAAATPQEAELMRATVRRAGFIPFVKRLFDSQTSPSSARAATVNDGGELGER